MMTTDSRRYAMQAKLWADGCEVLLNGFVAGLIANVSQGIVASLKMEDTEISRIEFRLDGKEVDRLEVNDRPVSLELATGFARRIIGGTLRGLVQPLKGVEEAGQIVI